jgi:hypothetical protein
MLGLTAVIFSASGLTVDVSNLYLHRQMAETAAEAACQAGAADLLAAAAGLSLPNKNFSAGASGDCSNSSASSICQYAAMNGFSGTGGAAIVGTSTPGSDVSYSFPSAVTGVTAPSSSVAAYPFLQVNVTENVPTTFMRLFTGSATQPVTYSTKCGLASVAGAPPMLVLNPSASGALTYSGSGPLNIVGGAARALQVNSTSATAISYTPPGLINVSKAGTTQTGTDVGVVGGPTASPSSSGQSGISLGTTGMYRSGSIPVVDPFAALAAPAGQQLVTPASTVSGTWVAYHQDGCPDNTGNSGNPSEACVEYAPGYYPNGITLPNSYSTIIFLPGVYYLNGPLTSAASNTLRNATPCTPSCGPLSSTTGTQTDGVTFYFASGSLNLGSCSGCAQTGIDPVAPTALTCDGSTPNSALGLPSSLTGNVLVAPCTLHGSYVDPAGDTSDVAGSMTNPGVRGLLVYQAHNNSTPPSLGGTGALVVAGTLYFHSMGYGTALALNNSGSTGSYVLGNVIADEVNLSGSGAVNVALQSKAAVPMVKIGMFQ